MTLNETALLLAVAPIGYAAGALAGYLWQGARYGRERRSAFEGSTLQPFAIAGSLLSVIVVVAFWHSTSP